MAYKEEDIKNAVIQYCSAGGNIPVLDDIPVDAPVGNNSKVVIYNGDLYVWDGSQWNVVSSETPLLIETTYSNLLSNRDSGNLIPGIKYRITDYACTTTQINTQSAGHQFDIVVEALSVKVLSEQASAMRHAEDTYFPNHIKFEAWKLKYCIDNDITRFIWADEINGKGVIYEMIDENNNRCGYDFKNIQFLPAVFSGVYSDLPNNVYLYTFNDATEIIENGFTDVVARDASIMRFVDLYIGGYFLSVVLDNEIQNYYDKTIIDDNDYMCQYINCGIVFCDVGSEESGSGGGTYNNKIGLCNHNFILGWWNRNNTTGYGCYDWSTGSNNFSWTSGNECYNWSTGNECYNWSIGNYCSYWTIGNGCSSWSTGNNCSSWSTGNECYNWSTGNYCFSWSTGNYCSSWSTGNECYNWSTGNICSDWSIGNYCTDWTVGNYCSSWSTGNECFSWSTGNECSSWSTGNICSDWSTGNNCSSWTSGNYCYNWTLSGTSYSFFNFPKIIIESGVTGYDPANKVSLDNGNSSIFIGWVGANNIESVIRFRQVTHSTSTATGKYMAEYYDPTTLNKIVKSKTGMTGAWS